MKVSNKYNKLKNIIENYKKVLVAFSGGVDSTFLLYICSDILGKDNVLSVTAVSASYTETEKKYVESTVAKLGVKKIIIHTDECNDPEFVKNSPLRCYHCKNHLFKKIHSIGERYGITDILYGATADDVNDYRPGHRAAEENGIESPLLEADLTKDEVRMFLRERGVDLWDKPANPCLASRIPYNEKITKKKLKTVEKAEKFLRDKGYSVVRVRHHGSIARIEVPEHDIESISNLRDRKEIVNYFKKLGFTYISLDLQGFRTGSLNETL